MSSAAGTTTQKAPWHLWVIGVVSLLWNSMGAFDYVMTKTKNEAYMTNFTPEQLEYFHAIPPWAVAFWAFAVWGGVLGSILLILRKRLAFPVFAICIVSFLITAVHNFVLTNGLEIMGTGGSIFSAVIFLSIVALLLYSRAMAKSGVLR